MGLKLRGELKPSTMEIRKWTTVDVHYTKNETQLAEKERNRLERMGYEYQQTDSSSDPFDYCDQYIKSGKTRLLNQVKFPTKFPY